MKKLQVLIHSLKGKSKKGKQFKFYLGSNTIRLMPQNYMVAFQSYGHWIVDPDAAIDDKLAAKIFITLRKGELKFGHPDKCVTALNSLL
jgi:hypothetical protein